MLPKNKLAYEMLTKLKIYAGPEHPHQANSRLPTELAVTITKSQLCRSRDDRLSLRKLDLRKNACPPLPKK